MVYVDLVKKNNLEQFVPLTELSEDLSRSDKDI